MIRYLKQLAGVQKPEAHATDPADIAPTQKRVLLVFPVFSHVYPPAFENFLRLVAVASRVCPEYKFDPVVPSRMALTAAMNMAVDTAIQHGHEYIIAFDDDCIPELIDFPRGDPRRYQVIPRLLALGQKGHPVVMGVGYMRGYPHTMTVGRLYPWGTTLVGNSDGTEVFKGFHWLQDIETHKDELDEDGVLTADFAGVPVVCIHRSVFTALTKPLFETTDGMGGTMTHDIYFCQKARAAGFSIKVDSHIDCGHIIESPIVNRETKKQMLDALKGTDLAPTI